MLATDDLRNYRVQTTLICGMTITIRAIRPDDKGKLADYFERLSPDSHYRRFLGLRRAFTTQELEYVTDPNFLEHGALAAAIYINGEEYFVGEAGYVALADGGYAEFALSVLDRYQRRGIGSVLLSHVAQLASHWGVRELRADVLSSNRTALDFLIQRDFEPIETSAGVYRLSCSLGSSRPSVLDYVVAADEQSVPLEQEALSDALLETSLPIGDA